MKHTMLCLITSLCTIIFVYGQGASPDDRQRKAISTLIDQYSAAREKQDTALLKTILTEDIDQLVSTGEWRKGIRAAVEGMLQSTAASPGTRTLQIEQVRMLYANSAIVDCKYILQNKNGTTRNMWSTFIIVADAGTWKIAAIRNMLPGK